MSRVFEMKQEAAAALESADRILQVAESANRPMTASEQSLFDVQMLKVNTLQPQIKQAESRSTLRALVSRL